jgi:hypothetical protein
LFRAAGSSAVVGEVDEVQLEEDDEEDIRADPLQQVVY